MRAKHRTPATSLPAVQGRLPSAVRHPCRAIAPEPWLPRRRRQAPPQPQPATTPQPHDPPPPYASARLRPPTEGEPRWGTCGPRERYSFRVRCSPAAPRRPARARAAVLGCGTPTAPAIRRPGSPANSPSRRAPASRREWPLSSVAARRSLPSGTGIHRTRRSARTPAGPAPAKAAALGTGPEYRPGLSARRAPRAA